MLPSVGLVRRPGSSPTIDSKGANLPRAFVNREKSFTLLFIENRGPLILYQPVLTKAKSFGRWEMDAKPYKITLSTHGLTPKGVGCSEG